jgi:phage terminase small subunit
MDKLTAKQQLFVEEYLLNPNATQAAIKAGYSQNTAKEIGCENLTKPNVAIAIIEAQQARSERTQIDADWLLRRLATEVDADLADIYDEVTGALKPMHLWPKIWRQGLVAGVDVQQQFAYVDGDKVPDGVITKIKISDRAKRLEMVGKHIGVKAFEDRVSTDHTGTISIVLSEKASEL